MRTVGVVMRQILAKHTLQLATADDQNPIETLAPESSDPARVGVGMRRSHGSTYYPQTLGSEDLVEGPRELRVTVADQEAARR